MTNNRNIGCRGGTDLLPVSFNKVSEELKHRIWDDYRTLKFSQEELAVKYRLSQALINKTVRTMPENLARVEGYRVEAVGEVAASAAKKAKRRKR